MLLFSDYVILIVSALFWIIWIFLWTNTLYKIYFWMIFGFLLFLVFNLKIELLELVRPDKLSVAEDFLLKNKAFCLWSTTISIFLIWLSFAIGWSGNPKNNNMIWGFILGFFLSIFYVWVNSYIIMNSFIPLSFLNDIFSFINTSYIFTLFTEKPHYIFLMMIFVLFWKIINLLILWFGVYVMEVTKNAFWNINQRQEEIDEMQWELDNEARKKKLFW